MADARGTAADFLGTAAAYLATFSDDERALVRHVFARVLAGGRVRRADLAEAVGISASAVASALGSLDARGVLTIDAATGDLVGARGLSLIPTAHAIVLRERTLYAYCAIDAVAIPVALGLDARVESRCHGCRAPITLSFARGALARDGGATIWAVERDPARSLRDYT